LLAELYWTDAAFMTTGAVLAYALLRWREHHQRELLNLQQKSVLDNARREAESLTREAQLCANEELLKLRAQTELTFVSRSQELAATEQRLGQREQLITQQLTNLVQQEQKLQEQQQLLAEQKCALTAQQSELGRVIQQRREELQRLARQSEAEVRALFLKETEQAALADANDLSKHILEAARSRAEEQARRIISLAIQRYAAEHTYESTSATIQLQEAEIKGRIIGREGRNIRAFEAATGVTVLIDDTPNAVVLSGFDPVRREVAREAMMRLILDGRIHPTRIEEIVAKVQEEMAENIVRLGEEAVQRAGLPALHPEIVKVLGRLRFRQSFSQNVLDHSVEVAHLVGLMAGELGLDITVAKRAGLLHDIGKALSHEVEGPHAIVGADFIKRLGESDEVVNGVASHHDEVPHTCPWGILVSAADAISASRPGARSETMTTYLNRLENLERLGLGFPGVEKCYAVQAGRELRVMVRPQEVNDEQAVALARNLTRKIEDELQYPGQIRVTVIRETRVVEFAK